MNNFRYKSLPIILVIIFSSLIGFLSLNTGPVLAQEVEFDPFSDIRKSALDKNNNLIIVGITSLKDVIIAKVDPNGTVIWKETFGGDEEETIYDFIIDESNNIILTGLTSSDNFPISENAFQPEYGGNSDLYLRILNADGKEILSSYFGGSGSEFGETWVNNIKLTKDNSIIIFGQTTSLDFPVSDNAFQPESYNLNTLDPTLFISKIGFDGTVYWSSYFGSTGRDFGTFDLDSMDNIILAGTTEGPGLPGTTLDQSPFHGAKDHFISKISQDGELIFTRYLGGSGDESSWEFKIDSEDNIISLSTTLSNDIEVSENAFQKQRLPGDTNSDLFINKLNPNGETIWSTYFGGSGFDFTDYCCLDNEDDNSRKDGPRLFLDSSDNVLFTTRTISTDLPTSNAFSENVAGVSSYLGKLSPDGSMIFGTYVTGWVSDLVLEDNNEIYIFGTDLYSQLPTTLNAAQASNAGALDSYYVKLQPNGTVEWSSYLGGSDIDETVKGIRLADGTLLIMGMTRSTDLPFRINAFGGDIDIFICIINQMGEVEHCRYVGGGGADIVNRSGLLFDATGYFILMGITTSQNLPLSNPAESGYEETALITKISTNGEEIWTNVLLPKARVIEDDDEPKGIDVKRYLLFGTLISSVLVLLYHSKFVYMKSRNLDNYLLNSKISEILSPIFHSQPQLIHIFGATKIFSENKIDDEIQSELPRAILDFKYFLHPVRLSIIKLLDENINLTTIQIKDFLGISWNEILFHLDSLKKTEYITINQQFIDGTTKTIVSVENKAISQYNTLKDVLFEFLDGTPNLEKYLDHVTQVKMRVEDHELYPNNH